MIINLFAGTTYPGVQAVELVINSILSYTSNHPTASALQASLLENFQLLIFHLPATLQPQSFNSSFLKYGEKLNYPDVTMGEHLFSSLIT